jgi:CBS domain containing-hemolysin-like protein
MYFLDSNSDNDLEQPPIVLPSRPHELAVEILKFLTAALSLVVVLVGLIGKYSWLSKPWVFSALIALGLLVLMWFAKPRLTAWLRRRQVRKRNQRFVAETDCQLRELLDQFRVFTSSSDKRSLIFILRAAFSQNTQAVEQIIVGDYIGSWLDSY